MDEQCIAVTWFDTHYFAREKIRSKLISTLFYTPLNGIFQMLPMQLHNSPIDRFVQVKATVECLVSLDCIPCGNLGKFPDLMMSCKNWMLYSPRVTPPVAWRNWSMSRFFESLFPITRRNVGLWFPAWGEDLSMTSIGVLFFLFVCCFLQVYCDCELVSGCEQLLCSFSPAQRSWNVVYSSGRELLRLSQEQVLSSFAIWEIGR